MHQFIIHTEKICTYFTMIYFIFHIAMCKSVFVQQKMNNNVTSTFCLRKSHAIENKKNSETAVLHDKQFKSSMQHVDFNVYSDPLPSKQFDFDI